MSQYGAGADNFSEEELQELYEWVDELTLTRPKRNISRDFSDGVMMAEVVKQFFPKSVDLHNYVAAQSVNKKEYNWHTLDTKTFKKLGFRIEEAEIHGVARSVPGVIERVLLNFRDLVLRKKSPAASYGGGRSMAKGPRRSEVGSVASSRPSTGTARRTSMGATGSGAGGRAGRGSDAAIAQKDEIIDSLKEAISFLEIKVGKMEEMIQLKDAKIMTMQAQLEEDARVLGI